MTELDQVIDDVARRMLEAAPADDFTARTMARVGAHRRMRLWWGLVPLGAAAGIALAVAAALVDQMRLVTLPGVPALASAPAPAFAPPAIALRDSARPAPAAPANVPSAAELAWQARRLPRLEGPAPIETENIQPAPLALPLLELKPLVTAPLIVEPLDVGK